MVSAELKTRLITSVILAVSVGLCLLVGTIFWIIAMVCAAMLMMQEWMGMATDQSPRWRIGGIVYIALAISCAIWLRMQPEGGWLLLFVISIVVITDSAAFFIGRTFGAHALAPTISPNKSWEGLAGGALVAALSGALLSALPAYPLSAVGGFLMASIIAPLSQLGDLLESYAKRKAGVKDSGDLLPGHGGALDRLDGYLAALPIFTIAVYVRGALIS